MTCSRGSTRKSCRPSPTRCTSSSGNRRCRGLVSKKRSSPGAAVRRQGTQRSHSTKGESATVESERRCQAVPFHPEWIDNAAAVEDKEAGYPRLGSGLKTFVINLARRPDRRAHVEAVCKELTLNYEIVNAVDGRGLSWLPQSAVQIVSSSNEKSKQTTPEIVSNNEKPEQTTNTSIVAPPACASAKPRGFQNLRTRMFRASWNEDGKPCEQLLKMAEHRLLPSELTLNGHELWGAVGCNLSHQIALRRLIAEPDLEWALILEDDATLVHTAVETKDIFDKGMKHIGENRPDWALVYLGGHISTNVSAPERRALQLNERLCSATHVYQTHAFVIRRSIAPLILERLQKGFAADAALVSWSRMECNRSRAFLFNPHQLLVQTGGADRWKDSDIFVEGEFFKRETARVGLDRYHFNAKRSTSRIKTIPRGIAAGSMPEVMSPFARPLKSWNGPQKEHTLKQSPEKTSKHANTIALRGSPSKENRSGEQAHNHGRSIALHRSPLKDCKELGQIRQSYGRPRSNNTIRNHPAPMSARQMSDLWQVAMQSNVSLLSLAGVAGPVPFTPPATHSNAAFTPPRSISTPCRQRCL